MFDSSVLVEPNKDRICPECGRIYASFVACCSHKDKKVKTILVIDEVKYKELEQSRKLVEAMDKLNDHLHEFLRVWDEFKDFRYRNDKQKGAERND